MFLDSICFTFLFLFILDFLFFLDGVNVVCDGGHVIASCFAASVGSADLARALTTARLTYLMAVAMCLVFLLPVILVE